MNRIDFTNLGGLPLTQDVTDFMQQDYLASLAAIGQLCGNKTILYGVEVTGSNVSDGWIVVDGELIKFVGGNLGATVLITETSVPLTFADNAVHDIQYTKVATTGVGGLFPFSDLTPLLSLQNIWRPGDIKERYCDAAYIAANFDANGFGVNAEKGWRILSKAVPGTEGRVGVQYNPNDPDFAIIGGVGGEKQHQLSIAEMPKHRHHINASANTDNTGVRQKVRVANVDVDVDGGYTDYVGSDQAHNNMQPYYVILKLIKL